MSDPVRIARVEVLADRTEGSRCDEGFLRVRRLILRNVYEDGTRSADYPCDIVSRRWVDAVAVVLWHRERDRVYVHLRKGTRAAVYLRREKKPDLVQPDPCDYLVLEELVAGRVPNRITVDPDTTEWAKVALQRMIEIV